MRQIFPAGQYKHIYTLTNPEGIVYPITFYVDNFSKDKTEW